MSKSLGLATMSLCSLLALLCGTAAADGCALTRVVPRRTLFSGRVSDVSAWRSNILKVWSPPSGTAASNTFAVRVRTRGETDWTDLFVYGAKVGHQAGAQFATSMVVFDFAGDVELEVTYRQGDIRSYDLRPVSYGLMATANRNQLHFQLTQKPHAPRKVVLRINDSWEEDCLHILTNPPEKDAPARSGANVLVINPGSEVPLRLPDGKDTYYFAPGLHVLPRGLWIEVDLGRERTIGKLGLLAGPFGGNPKWLYPQRFVVEAKTRSADRYVVAYNGLENRRAEYFTHAFPEVRARYVRLRLAGSNTASGYVFSNVIGSFEVYEADGTVDLARNRAVAGAMPGYRYAVDGDPTTMYATKSLWANMHAGESFFISRHRTTVYIAPGAVVKGSILSDEFHNVTVRGRGILDCSGLTHHPQTLYEARVGAVWLLGGSRNVVEGITIVDPPMWAIVMNFSSAPLVRNVNVIGCVVNADGIHMSGCTKGVVEGAFVRSCDDGFVAYHYGPTKDIAVRNCVLWQDDARNILLGMGDTPGCPIENVTFSDIDVLNQRGVYVVDRYTGVLQLWAHGGNVIRNITLRDVRIDGFKEPAKSAIFQCRTDPIDPANPTHRPGTMITGIRLERITYRGSGEQPSLLQGAGEDSKIGAIRIRKYSRQGRIVEDVQRANIHVGRFARPPVFLDAQGEPSRSGDPVSATGDFASGNAPLLPVPTAPRPM